MVINPTRQNIVQYPKKRHRHHWKGGLWTGIKLSFIVQLMSKQIHSLQRRETLEELLSSVVNVSQVYFGHHRSLREEHCGERFKKVDNRDNKQNIARGTTDPGYRFYNLTLSIISLQLKRGQFSQKENSSYRIKSQYPGSVVPLAMCWRLNGF